MTAKNIKNTELEETPVSEEESSSKDIVEIGWEDLEELFSLKQNLHNMEDYYANLSLTFEKNKAAILGRIFQAESALFSMAEELKNQQNLDESLTYELKLPNKPNDKGYFVKRD